MRSFSLSFFHSPLHTIIFQILDNNNNRRTSTPQSVSERERVWVSERRTVCFNGTAFQYYDHLLAMQTKTTTAAAAAAATTAAQQQQVGF